MRIFLLILAAIPLWAVSADDTYWWPEQKLPAAVVKTTDSSEWKSAGKDIPVKMLLQSVSGLAAKAVNEGKGDELVWIHSNNIDVNDWGKRFRKTHPQIKVRDTLGPWELVERYKQQGIIKGYILFRVDTSKPHPTSKSGHDRKNIDYSSNIATSLAGLFDAVIIDESLEAEAIKRGLPLIMDVRNKTQEWCFDTYKEQFSRDMLLAMDPKMTGARDYAISQKCYAVFGMEDSPLPKALEWVNPPAPVLGWIGGNEFYATRLATIYGHFQTATSITDNLPLLTAGSRQGQIKKYPSLDPRSIDWDDQRPTVAFTVSDGDNFKFYYSSYLQTSPWYWSSPDRGKIPFGWGAPLCHAIQLAPQTQDYIVETRTPNDSIIEWQGGYYYPDFFASERGEQRQEILARQSRRTWNLMKRAGATMIAFNYRSISSNGAKNALETFVGETDGLTAVLLFQYSPYNAGKGATLWFPDKRGIDIPVITLRYQIWWNLKDRPNAGTPARVAHEIIKTVSQPETSDNPHDAWAMIHAWSWFKKAPGDDENAETIKRGSSDYESQGGKRGYEPVLWAAERLPESIRVVSPEEMAWRIRMKQRPEQTKKLLQQFPNP